MASNPVPAAKPLAQLGDVSSLAAACGEPAWLAAFREQAAALARSFELPDRARHLWRFTDPAQFLPQEDPAKLGPGAPVPSWQLEEQLASAVLLAGPTPHLVFLAPEASQAGVEVVPLGDKRLASYLGKAVPADHGFLEALNAAAFRPGVAVLVPAGVRLEHPIRLRVVASSPLLLPRVLLVVGENASVEVLEGHVGDGGMVLGVTEAFVADGGELRYDLVQRWDGPVVGHLTSRVVLGEGARARLALASFGGRVTKVDTGAILAGKGAEVETYGVCLGIGEQHFDHHTEHIHQASKTQSNLDFKVALAGKARSVYTGLIRIAQDAAGCEAYQENRNLLLAENARAESIPELEILNEDVRCTHGATVAPLDEEQVFYLRSRGLPQHQAMRLIVYGFLDQTLSRLPQATRERIEALVAGRLHGEVL